MNYTDQNPYKACFKASGADFLVYGFTNKVFTSSTWVIENQATNEVVIVDPGDSANNIVHQLLSASNRQAKAIILTHEHFDHCSGVNYLAELYSPGLIATADCHKNIAIPGRNHSLYYEGLQTFSIKHPAPGIIETETNILLAGIPFTFIPTPGHTPGSLCIIAGNAAFTGDTFMENTPTPLKFHNSNRQHYNESLRRLKEIFTPGTTIFPGHGAAFNYKEGMIQP